MSLCNPLCFQSSACSGLGWTPPEVPSAPAVLEEKGMEPESPFTQGGRAVFARAGAVGRGHTVHRPRGFSCGQRRGRGAGSHHLCFRTRELPSPDGLSLGCPSMSHSFLGHLWSKERFAEVGSCLNMHIEGCGTLWEGHLEGRGRWLQEHRNTCGFERDREPGTEQRNQSNLSSTSANTSFPDSEDAALAASPPWI